MLASPSQNWDKLNMNVRLLLSAIIAIFLATLPVHAASDYFLMLDGIKGESLDKTHRDAIEIQSFSFGVSNSGTLVSGGGGGAGKATFSDISFLKNLDKASPLLYLHCAQGKHIPTATLFVRKAGERPLEYFVVKLTDVIVTSVQTSGSSGGGAPTESFSLNFRTIEFTYTPQKADGSPDIPVKSGWDIATNTSK